MNLNDIIIVGGIAVFLLPVVYLMGYARYEKQHKGWAANARIGFKNERDALRAQHMDELVRERNVIRELEISLLQAGEAIEREVQDHAATERNRVTSDGYRKAIIEALVMNDLWNFVKHSDVPANMLQILMVNAAQHAVDPAVNQKAKNLHTRGVRKGAKMGREQMRKLMQKSIDNQANTIQSLNADLKVAHEEFDSLLRRKNIAQQALNNVLADKMPIRSIRKAFKVSVLTERGRLTELSKKGE